MNIGLIIKPEAKEVLYAARAIQKHLLAQRSLAVAHDFDLSDDSHRLIIFQSELHPTRAAQWTIGATTVPSAVAFANAAARARSTRAAILCFRRLATRDESRQEDGKSQRETTLAGEEDQLIRPKNSFTSTSRSFVYRDS